MFAIFLTVSFATFLTAAAAGADFVAVYTPVSDDTGRLELRQGVHHLHLNHRSNRRYQRPWRVPRVQLQREPVRESDAQHNIVQRLCPLTSDSSEDSLLDSAAFAATPLVFLPALTATALGFSSSSDSSEEVVSDSTCTGFVDLSPYELVVDGDLLIVCNR